MRSWSSVRARLDSTFGVPAPDDRETADARPLLTRAWAGAIPLYSNTFLCIVASQSEDSDRGGRMSTAAIEPALAQPEISTDELSSRIGEPGLCVDRRAAVVPLQRLERARRCARRPHPGRRRASLRVADAARRDRAPGASGGQGHHGGRRDRRLRQRRGNVARPRSDRGEHRRTAAHVRAAGRTGLQTRACPSSGLPATRSWSTTTGSGSCSAAAGRKRRRRAGTSSSTSTSAFPRSTPTATSPVRSTWTRTSSRARATGIGALRRISRRPCGRSGSRATPR